MAGEVVGTERLLDRLSELARPVLNAKRRESVAWEQARRARRFAQQFGPWSPCDGPTGHQHEPLAPSMRRKIILPPERLPDGPAFYRRWRVRIDEPVEALLRSAAVSNAFRSVLLSARVSQGPVETDRRMLGIPETTSTRGLLEHLTRLVGHWLEHFHVGMWIDGATMEPVARVGGVGAAVAYGLYAELAEAQSRTVRCRCGAVWAPERNDHGELCGACASAKHGRDKRRRDALR